MFSDKHSLIHNVFEQNKKWGSEDTKYVKPQRYVGLQNDQNNAHYQ